MWNFKHLPFLQISWIDMSQKRGNRKGKVFCLHRGFRGNIILSSKRPHILCEIRARA